MPGGGGRRLVPGGPAEPVRRRARGTCRALGATPRQHRVRRTAPAGHGIGRRDCARADQASERGSCRAVDARTAIACGDAPASSSRAARVVERPASQRRTSPSTRPSTSRQSALRGRLSLAQDRRLSRRPLLRLPARLARCGKRARACSRRRLNTRKRSRRLRRRRPRLNSSISRCRPTRCWACRSNARCRASSLASKTRSMRA